MKGKKELLLLMIQTMNNSILFVLSPHRKPPMNHNQSYSTVPHIPASRLQDADGSMRPHTYGVHPRPCAAIATEPYRPTACAGEHPYPAAYTAMYIVHCTLYIVHCSSYTFSAKERDSETGLSYFGSRYYSSDLSIWLSVDPMSDKYPSLSPYSYCANNPVKVVDPNGEEIWIVGEDGNQYKYNNGNFYTKDGKLYTPEAGSFLSTAGNAIDKLKGTTTGNKLISAFEGPDNKDVIIKSASKSTCDNLTINSAGEFVSQTILWNTEGTDVQTTNGVQKSSTTDLAHELSHVYDNARKINGLNDLCTKGGVRSEWRAVYKENLIRKELGLPYRTGYTFKNPDNTTYFVRMINRKGEPYMPNSLQWIPFDVCKKKNN